MKKLLSTVVLVASIASALVMSLSLQAEAQTRQHALRGLAKIEILIEDLDSNSLECGLTKDVIRNAVLYPTSSAKFQVVDAYPLGDWDRRRPTRSLRATLRASKGFSNLISDRGLCS